MRICVIDAVNLLALTRAESFVGIQAPGAFEQTLSAQDFMNTGDTARELVCCIEKRGVAIRDFDVSLQNGFRNWLGRGSQAVALVSQLYSALCNYRSNGR